jgi:hypothetical protein
VKITVRIANIIGERAMISNPRNNPSYAYRERLRNNRYDAAHREERKVKGRAIRKRRLENKLCIDCGAPLVDDEVRKCNACMARKHRRRI